MEYSLGMSRLVMSFCLFVFFPLSALLMGILQAMSQRALRLPNPMSPLHSCLPGSHLQALTLN